jgi:hypothetical protein
MTAVIALVMTILCVLECTDSLLPSQSRAWRARYSAISSKNIRDACLLRKSVHIPLSMINNERDSSLDDLNARIRSLRRQLLEFEGSWFPYRSRGLREELRQAEEEARRAQEEARRAQEEKTVVIYELNEENIPERVLFSRKIFEKYLQQSKYMYKICCKYFSKIFLENNILSGIFSSFNS